MSGIEPETYAFIYTSIYITLYLRIRLYIAHTLLEVKRPLSVVRALVLQVPRSWPNVGY